jgi:hypothetical protein
MRRPKSLLFDTRGAVLVMGLVMATVLVGLLWHLLGVGDAIVYRERMQEAADSTAFESAVWHARTMNLLVVLNVVMSAILAVLIIWRTIELLLQIAAILLFLLALIPGLEELDAVAVRVEGWVEQMFQKDVQTISKNVQKGLERVNKAEKMVATWAPVINVVAPTVTNTDFFGGASSVNVTFPVSLSLIPPVEALLPDKAEVAVRMNMGKAFPAMPVQEGKYDDLCSHAAVFVPNSIASALASMHAPSAVSEAIRRMGGAFNDVVKSAPEFFCKPLTAPEPGKGEIADGAKKDCQDREKEFDKNDPRIPRVGLMCNDGTLSPTCLCDGRWVDGAIVEDHKGCCSHHKGIKVENGNKVCEAPDAGPPPKFDEGECEEVAEEEAEKKKKDRKGPEVSANPAAVWAVAKNGYEFFQVWSFANGDPSVSFGDDRGVAIANNGDAGSHPEPMSYQFALAEAEYYNDAGENLWNLGWRARLRRVRDPLTLTNAAEWVGKWTTGKVTAAISKVYSGKAGKALDKLDKALDWIDPKGELYDRWWTEDAITKRAAKGIHDGVYDLGLDNFGAFVADQLIGTAHKKIIH